MFRWAHIAKLFLPPVLHIVLALLLISPSILIAPYFIPKIEPIKWLLFYVLLFLAWTYQVIYQLALWFADRKNFSEAEHFFILTIVAIYSSAAVGALNYGVYRLNKQSFVIDENIRKFEFAELVSSRKELLGRSRRIIVTSERLAAEISASPQTSISKTKITPWHSVSQSIYKIDLDLPEVSIYLEQVAFRNVSNSSVKADAWGESIQVSDFNQWGAGDVIRPLQQDTISKDDLVRVFKFNADWERNNWQTNLENHLKEIEKGGAEFVDVPLSLFLYQGAMAALKSDPQYMKPASFITRLIAFGFAFFNTIYFGVFISLIVLKHWATPTKIDKG